MMEANDLNELSAALGWPAGISHGPVEFDVLLARIAKMRQALTLIATPMRPDGTWNRDRDACRQLAEEALRGN
jgi:hypothetical protein